MLHAFLTPADRGESVNAGDGDLRAKIRSGRVVLPESINPRHRILQSGIRCIRFAAVAEHRHEEKDRLPCHDFHAAFFRPLETGFVAIFRLLLPRHRQKHIALHVAGHLDDSGLRKLIFQAIQHRQRFCVFSGGEMAGRAVQQREGQQRIGFPPGKTREILIKQHGGFVELLDFRQIGCLEVKCLRMPCGLRKTVDMLVQQRLRLPVHAEVKVRTTEQMQTRVMEVRCPVELF